MIRKASSTINWRSGFFRAWIAFSIGWMGFCAWTSDLACPIELAGISTGAGPWCEFQNAEPFKYYGSLGVKMLGLPLLMALGFIATSWILTGFRRT
jgi:hypothetical protein